MGCLAAGRAQREADEGSLQRQDRQPGRLDRPGNLVNFTTAADALTRPATRPAWASSSPSMTPSVAWTLTSASTRPASLTRPCWARLQDLDGYTEFSQSGTGVHAIVRAKLPPGTGAKSAGVEMYDAGRFFAMTGAVVEGFERITVPDRQDQVTALHLAVFGAAPEPSTAKPAPAATGGPRRRRTCCSACLRVRPAPRFVGCGRVTRPTTAATKARQTWRLPITWPFGRGATPPGWTGSSASPVCSAPSGTAPRGAGRPTGKGPLRGRLRGRRKCTPQPNPCRLSPTP